MGIIIGISGVACSGKDTTGNFFVREFGFTNISFADPIKRACADIFDWDEETLWGDSEKRNVPDLRYPRDIAQHSNENITEYLTPRYALQTFGTQFGRHCYKDIWVKYGIRIAKTILDHPNYQYIKSKGIIKHTASQSTVGGIVFTDCRFKNEIELIKEADGILIRLKRPGAGLSGSAAQHSSELEQQSISDDVFDFIIDNDGTIEDLQNNVIKIGTSLGLSQNEPLQLELPFS